MQFILLGFDQDAGVRLYAFQGIVDRTRTDFTVGVDVALLPRYGIQMQELPLLCRGLLERHGEDGEQHAFTFTEEEMRGYANTRAMEREAAALKRKPWRKSAAGEAGAV